MPPWLRSCDLVRIQSHADGFWSYVHGCLDTGGYTRDLVIARFEPGDVSVASAVTPVTRSAGDWQAFFERYFLPPA